MQDWWGSPATHATTVLERTLGRKLWQLSWAQFRGYNATRPERASSKLANWRLVQWRNGQSPAMKRSECVWILFAVNVMLLHSQTNRDTFWHDGQVEWRNIACLFNFKFKKAVAALAIMSLMSSITCKYHKKIYKVGESRVIWATWVFFITETTDSTSG